MKRPKFIPCKNCGRRLRLASIRGVVCYVHPPGTRLACERAIDYRIKLARAQMTREYGAHVITYVDTM